MPKTDIATFNVNSVKSRLPILETWLSSENAPDILCLQETKCRDEEFPAAFFEEKGYHCVFKGMKSYNGVAVVSRARPDECEFGLGDEGEEGRDESEQARVALVRFGELTVLNTYIPQGKEIDNPDYPYKLRFLGRVRGLLERKCRPSDKVVWLGDLNVAPSAIDVTNPKNKKDHVCFHQDVKEALSRAMEWGLVDIFREHLPGEGEYTFWDYRVKDSLARNIGWRIDHILGTQSAAALCTGVRVERALRAMERPSDHTAVVGAFEL
ncbi:MAG: exodeoxyribonuclease III [bacterium]|nr:exodeoxyribonuclease III [bacterium]